ncbi:SLAM family member 5-like [Melanotaenia boesemani]|uniref:SLAM family member 5-like n=1 Tax=Melanotaenia boesemani TaxID=1250792 RepID=UPI001C05D3E5|nr:SLAM family member 5-like [Melanotaenia boesemani]
MKEREMRLRVLLITGFIFSVDTPVKKQDRKTVNLHVKTSGHQFRSRARTFGPLDPVIASVIITNDNGPIPVNVLEGNNVTLNSGLQELDKDHNVMWTQGQDFSGDQIAQWKASIVTISESYQDILQMDPTTGDLVFLRVTKSLTGFYCVKILKGREPHVLRQYHLAVYEPVSVPKITTTQTNIRAELTNDGFCYVSCSVENGPDVNLTWYQGEKQISQTSNNNISISLSLPLEIVKEETYTCEANNPVSTETDSINSKQECPPHGSGGNIYAVIGVVVGSVALVALIVYLIHRCINKRGGINCVETIPMDSVQNNSEGNVEPLLDNNTQ